MERERVCIQASGVPAHVLVQAEQLGAFFIGVILTFFPWSSTTDVLAKHSSDSLSLGTGLLHGVCVRVGQLSLCL